MMQIKNGQLIVYEVDPQYRDYLRSFDNRVNTKDARRFCGVLVSHNNQDYCVPLSTKVLTSSGKRRRKEITTTILYKKTPIAVLLYNNMIPVNDKVIKIVDLEFDRDRDYIKNELRFLNSHEMEIVIKSNNTLNELTKFEFYKKLCCDFELLSEKCREWEVSHSLENEIEIDDVF